MPLQSILNTRARGILWNYKSDQAIPLLRTLQRFLISSTVKSLKLPERFNMFWSLVISAPLLPLSSLSLQALDSWCSLDKLLPQGLLINWRSSDLHLAPTLLSFRPFIFLERPSLATLSLQSHLHFPREFLFPLFTSIAFMAIWHTIHFAYLPGLLFAFFTTDILVCCLWGHIHKIISLAESRQ